MKWLELITIIFGLFCMGLSLVLSYRFKKVNSVLSKALSHQLLAEAFVGLVTVVFAITSWIGIYGGLSAGTVVIMRWLIFGVSSFTSINLYLSVRNIERNGDE
jgi:hypothetical protein